LTDPGYVHYIMIVDRSGSMSTIRADMNGGIHTFVDKQLEGVDGNKRTVSFYQFDTEHDRVHDFDLLEKVKTYELVPRGGTALLDACGQAITEVGQKLSAMDEDKRPGYVMVIIVTDGMENSSRKYTRAQVKKMVTHQQDKYGWRFTYLGVEDAFNQAESIGITYPSVLSWLGTSRSVTASVGNALGVSVSSGTSPTCSGIYYTDQQREEVLKS
jgi:uncharacterized protein YegL